MTLRGNFIETQSRRVGQEDAGTSNSPVKGCLRFFRCCSAIVCQLLPLAVALERKCFERLVCLRRGCDGCLLFLLHSPVDVCRIIITLQSIIHRMRVGREGENRGEKQYAQSRKTKQAKKSRSDVFQVQTQPSLNQHIAMITRLSLVVRVALS